MSISMFVKKDTRITVPVYVYQTDDGQTEASATRSEVPESKEVETVNFVFRKPNYADSNLFMKQLGLSNSNQIDIAALQDIAMNNMLVEWTFKDEDGNKVPVNKSKIDTLEPAIGRAASLGFLSQVKF